MTTPAHMATGMLHDLLLVRMALANPTPKKVRQDLSELLADDMSADEFDELRSELVRSGQLTKGKRNTFALTPAGHERALRFLGVPALAARINWRVVVARYLFPQAAGLSASAAEKFRDGDRLSALLLAKKYSLPTKACGGLRQAAEALACRHLGFPEESTFEGVLCAVLSKSMGSERLAKEKILKQLPLFETGLTRVSAQDIRRKLVADWVHGGRQHSQLPPARERFDLASFASTVRALALRSPREERFHDNKAFIAPLWRASQREPSFPRMTLPEFKSRLWDANQQHLLHLSRADLVQAMDPQAVTESETSYDNATFHFVLVEGTGS